MVDPNDYVSRPLFARVARLRRVTFMMLVIERAGRSFLPLFTWICLFAGLWLSGIAASVAPWLQQGLSAAFIIGVFYLAIRAVRTFTWPRREETDLRLQEQSGVRHRPLAAIDDKLAGKHGGATEAIWDKSRDALPGAISKLRLAMPRPVLALADPMALRMAAILVLIIGAVMAGSAWQLRLRAGLWPFAFSPSGIMASDVATITITPPVYTGRETVILKGVMKDGDAPVEIAESSTIKVHVTGGFGKPILSMDKAEKELDALDDKSFRLETPIVPGSEIAITQTFLPRVRAHYKIIPDTEPGIAQAGDVAVLSRGELRFPLLLRDDYGVSDLQMRLDIDASLAAKPRIGDYYDEIRAVMTKGGEDVKIQPVYNLSFHPWAGLPVRITFLATDSKGQAAILKPITLTLPERQFKNQVAAHLITLRKQLIVDPEGDMSAIRDGLITVASRPDLHRGDVGVHLALSAAVYRVVYSPGLETSRALVSLLWDVAVHIEDGDSSMAMRDLKEARENLEAALNDPNATDEQIAALMQQLQDAMQRYMQEMARDAQRRQQDGAPPPAIPPEMLSQMITPQDMEMFFAQLQAQALSGDKNAAREMLSRLSQMMDMMDPAMNAEMPKDVQKMGEALNQLQDIIDAQQDLLDQTRAQMPQAPRTPSTGDPVLDDILKKLGQERQTQHQSTPEEQQKKEQALAQCQSGQEGLRGKLGQLMGDVGAATGQVPPNMSSAEQEMRQASSALSENNAGQAADHQQRTIEQLQQAKEDLSQKLQQRLSQMTGFSMGGSGMRTDPLGRPYGKDTGTNPLLGEKVKIPDESDRKKIEDILQTLREKSGDMTRPQEELDYYRRLLKQF